LPRRATCPAARSKLPASPIPLRCRWNCHPGPPQHPRVVPRGLPPPRTAFAGTNASRHAARAPPLLATSPAAHGNTPPLPISPSLRPNSSVDRLSRSSSPLWAVKSTDRTSSQATHTAAPSPSSPASFCSPLIRRLTTTPPQPRLAPAPHHHTAPLQLLPDESPLAATLLAADESLSASPRPPRPLHQVRLELLIFPGHSTLAAGDPLARIRRTPSPAFFSLGSRTQLL